MGTKAKLRRMVGGLPTDTVVVYGYAATPYGEALVGVIDGAACFLTFTSGGRAAALAELGKTWPGATLKEDKETVSEIAAAIFSGETCDVCVQGTEMQIRVWETLMSVGAGSTVSYSELASMSGYPHAVRAVASAVARNPVPVLIPCHRVVRKSGETGNFRYGTPMKELMLRQEKSGR